MPIARLSGRVVGKEDRNRKTRAEVLYRLFGAGWDIYNGNGDQVITLDNVQEKIAETDAFVFMPDAELEDLFNAASIFVGFQTNDAELKGKPAVILDSGGSWQSFLDLITHMHKRGTVKEDYYNFLTVARKSKEVVSILEENYSDRVRIEVNEPDIFQKASNGEHDEAGKPDFNVCVFCSASIKDQEYLDDGYNLGKALANNGWGCISGAGATGIMGKVVEGAVDSGGWTAGSNVPHIVELEGLPDGLSVFWPRGDIYTRMQIMIEESDCFVIMPGGMGTVQELFALILIKERGYDMMRDKEIIIVNKKKFWNPLVDMLKEYEVDNMVNVIENSSDVINKINSIIN